MNNKKVLKIASSFLLGFTLSLSLYKETNIGDQIKKDDLSVTPSTIKKSKNDSKVLLDENSTNLIKTKSNKIQVDKNNDEVKSIKDNSNADDSSVKDVKVHEDRIKVENKKVENKASYKHDSNKSTEHKVDNTVVDKVNKKDPIDKPVKDESNPYALHVKEMNRIVSSVSPLLQADLKGHQFREPKDLDHIDVAAFVHNSTELYGYIFTQEGKSHHLKDPGVVIHELAHMFDHRTGISNTLEWSGIFDKEWANKGLYGSTNRTEAFADSVAAIYANNKKHYLNDKPLSKDFVRRALNLKDRGSLSKYNHILDYKAIHPDRLLTPERDMETLYDQVAKENLVVHRANSSTSKVIANLEKGSKFRYMSKNLNTEFIMIAFEQDGKEIGGWVINKGL